MFGVFVFLFVVVQLVMQIIPSFVTQRTLYESRERQSKTYAWPAFILSNIAVEFFWNTVRPCCIWFCLVLLTNHLGQIMAILSFLVWYYPVGLYRNAEYTGEVHTRGTLAVLIIWAVFLFSSSFAHMLISGMDSDQLASALSNILFIMMYAFCGILAGPDALPGFWIFMYRVNPFTYLVSSLLSATLGDAPMHCADNEILSFFAPSGMSCGEYMQDYRSAHGGYLLNPDARGSDECNFCSLEYTNQYLAGLNVNFANRWRDFGLLWVYIVVNTVGAIAFYWIFRVPKGKKAKKE